MIYAVVILGIIIAALSVFTWRLRAKVDKLEDLALTNKGRIDEVLPDITRNKNILRNSTP